MIKFFGQGTRSSSVKANGATPVTAPTLTPIDDDVVLVDTLSGLFDFYINDGDYYAITTDPISPTYDDISRVPAFENFSVPFELDSYDLTETFYLWAIDDATQQINGPFTAVAIAKPIIRTLSAPNNIDVGYADFEITTGVDAIAYCIRETSKVPLYTSGDVVAKAFTADVSDTIRFTPSAMPYNGNVWITVFYSPTVYAGPVVRFKLLDRTEFFISPTGSLDEGNTIDVIVARVAEVAGSIPPGAATVDISQTAGDATEGVDYTLTGAGLSGGTISFADGDISQTLTLTGLETDGDFSNHFVYFQLSNPSNPISIISPDTGFANIDILNNDTSPPSLAFIDSDVSMTEGANPNLNKIQIRRAQTTGTTNCTLHVPASVYTDQADIPVTIVDTTNHTDVQIPILETAGNQGGTVIQVTISGSVTGKTSGYILIFDSEQNVYDGELNLPGGLDGSVDRGFFLFRNTNQDQWYFRMYNGDQGSISGSGYIYSSLGFTEVTTQSIEAGDVVDWTTDPTRITFNLFAQGTSFDGIRFRIPVGTELSITTDQDPTDLYLGLGKTQVSMNPTYQVLAPISSELTDFSVSGSQLTAFFANDLDAQPYYGLTISKNGADISEFVTSVSRVEPNVNRTFLYEFSGVTIDDGGASINYSIDNTQIANPGHVVQVRDGAGIAANDMQGMVDLIATKTISTITNISKANPGVVTYTGLDPANGDTPTLSVAGMTELNGVQVTVANVNKTAKTFEIGVNTTGYGTFTSGSFDNGLKAAIKHIAIRYESRDVETSQGVFDTSHIESDMTIAKANGYGYVMLIQMRSFGNKEIYSGNGVITDFAIPGQWDKGRDREVHVYVNGQEATGPGTTVPGSVHSFTFVNNRDDVRISPAPVNGTNNVEVKYGRDTYPDYTHDFSPYPGPIWYNNNNNHGWTHALWRQDMIDWEKSYYKGVIEQLIANNDDTGHAFDALDALEAVLMQETALGVSLNESIAEGSFNTQRASEYIDGYEAVGGQISRSLRGRAFGGGMINQIPGGMSSLNSLASKLIDWGCIVGSPDIFQLADNEYEPPGVQLTNISRANPAVFTYVSSGWDITNNTKIQIVAPGMTYTAGAGTQQLDGALLTVTNRNAGNNTFQAKDGNTIINTSASPAFSSGAYKLRHANGNLEDNAYRKVYRDTFGNRLSMPWHQHNSNVEDTWGRTSSNFFTQQEQIEKAQKLTTDFTTAGGYAGLGAQYIGWFITTSKSGTYHVPPNYIPQSQSKNYEDDIFQAIRDNPDINPSINNHNLWRLKSTGQVIANQSLTKVNGGTPQATLGNYDLYMPATSSVTLSVATLGGASTFTRSSTAVNIAEDGDTTSVAIDQPKFYGNDGILIESSSENLSVEPSDIAAYNAVSGSTFNGPEVTVVAQWGGYKASSPANGATLTAGNAYLVTLYFELISGSLSGVKVDPGPSGTAVVSETPTYETAVQIKGRLYKSEQVMTCTTTGTIQPRFTFNNTSDFPTVQHVATNVELAAKSSSPIQASTGPYTRGDDVLTFPYDYYAETGTVSLVFNKNDDENTDIALIVIANGSEFGKVGINSSNQLYYELSTATPVTLTSSALTNGAHKVAVSYSDQNIYFALDGTQIGATQTGKTMVPSGASTTIRIGSTAAGSYSNNTPISDVKMWTNKQLTLQNTLTESTLQNTPTELLNEATVPAGNSVTAAGAINADYSSGIFTFQYSGSVAAATVLYTGTSALNYVSIELTASGLTMNKVFNGQVTSCSYSFSWVVGTSYKIGWRISPVTGMEIYRSGSLVASNGATEAKRDISIGTDLYISSDGVTNYTNPAITDVIIYDEVPA